MSVEIDIDGVTADFGTYRAVDNVSVRIQPGEFFSFLGPSGCGKTTLLRMISGFNDPTKGTIRIDGRDMAGVDPNHRPTALIFQNLALFPLMTVWENIAYGLKVRGVSKSVRRKKAMDLLDLIKLPDAADKRVSQLSGGQRQRIAIARALAVEPKVMLLDEPLSALDLKLRQHMRAELRMIQQETGVTFIYITHDQGEALAMSDRIGVMSKGKLQQVDAPRAIYTAPVNGFVASFVGETMRLPGKIASTEGDMARFETPLGAFVARRSPALTEGGKVSLFVRPENVRLSPAAEGPNSIPMTIDAVGFEGNVINILGHDRDKVQHVAQLRGQTSIVLPSAGDQVHFTFDPEDALILSDDTLAATV